MTSQGKIYCVYTDREIWLSAANNEHIIPLALGGCNELQIAVDRDFNSEVGSRIDGAMAKDFLVAMRRTQYDTRGHSGQEPWVVSKHAAYGLDERRAQVRMSRRHGLEVWDAVQRRTLESRETAGQKITMEVLIDIDLPSRFVAKVALAAGYFAYGDTFREHVRHQELRVIMNHPPGGDEGELRDIDVRADFPLLSPKPEPTSRLAILRRLCRAVRGSMVFLVPSPGALAVVVGILGDYVGLLNVTADTTAFPNHGEYRWGHVLLCLDGKLQRGSFRELLELVAGIRAPESQGA